MGATATKPKVRRALRDVVGGDRLSDGSWVDAIPNELLGNDRGRLLRKLVLIAIAKSANHDGGGAWPSRETIAHRCAGVSVEAVRKQINWLVKHGLLRVESKAVPTSEKGRTNRYTIIWPDEHQQIEVAGDVQDTGNNRGEHQQQLGVSPANRSCYNSTLDSTQDRNTNPAPENGDQCAPGFLSSGYEEHSQLQTTTANQQPHSTVTQDTNKNQDPCELKAVNQRVWDYYLAATEKNPRVAEFTPVRQKKGLARLQECLKKTKGNLANAEALMKIAIDALAASEFHMARGKHKDGPQFNDWQNHLFKNYEQMERWWFADRGAKG